MKKEPLKLMPLDEFKKLVAAIARVPKDATEKAERPKQGRSNKKQPRSK